MRLLRVQSESNLVLMFRQRQGNKGTVRWYCCVDNTVQVTSAWKIRR
jgi:hypothetical protein